MRKGSSICYRGWARSIVRIRFGTVGTGMRRMGSALLWVVIMMRILGHDGVKFLTLFLEVCHTIELDENN